MASFLNWSNCKKFMLDRAAATRAHKFTRVSGSVKDMLELSVRNAMISFVKSHPGVGMTLTTGEKNEKSQGDNTP